MALRSRYLGHGDVRLAAWLKSSSHDQYNAETHTVDSLVDEVEEYDIDKIINIGKPGKPV